MPKLFEYIRATYKVEPFIGQGVVVDGHPGVIVKDCGKYIGVNFDDDKPGVVDRCHPTWRVEYGKVKDIRKMTRSQERYRAWRDADCGVSFRDWLGIKRRATGDR